MNEVIEKALRLKEIDKEIVKAVVNRDVDSLMAHVSKFVDLKKEIKKKFIDNSIDILAGVKDKAARAILHKVFSGEPFPVEKAMEGSRLADFLVDELTEQEIEQLGSDHFYSWFSHYEYIEGLYNIGSLILAVGKIPNNFERFVHEARSCFVFQQYNAVFTLCRTMLEITVKDLCIKNRILPKDVENIKQRKARIPDLYELINNLCDRTPKYRKFRGKLHKIRSKGNFIVHGNKTVTKKEAETLLKETLDLIHFIYED